MIRVVFSCLIALSVIACNKDNFKTEPQVEIKSLGPDEVRKGELFTFRATVRDKEGDVQDSVFFVEKIFVGTTLISKDTTRYSLAKFGTPSNSTIEVSAVYTYGELRDGYVFIDADNIRDRELAIGIIVRDKAGHRSAYVESKKILLKKV